ncbi:predicted protein [Sclerotinia sclerotiorum 1980 UF-70]|uniref:Uncharacterized protein n=1 Tax=Sclerotinia sclerotiorum (strain ATCC 18683 / 1980 / Ss-1) TaxID=665079 RepID=A7F3C5_SCLS1|nr:predicted protein [Sclerotinia sclerotiorum 1980 UF-70]EDN97246.1 predicted protein [Sclerotinia sclerotiorum 1980 UF-70]
MFKVLGTMWFPLITRNPFYTPLTTGPDEEAETHVGVKYEERKSKWNILLILTACFASAALGFAFARILNTHSIVLTPSGPQCTLLVEEELEPHMQRSHMRHCLDFLRQSLMCCGDSSIEKVDPELKGVTGWGTEHICTSWEQLQKWVGGRQRLDR